MIKNPENSKKKNSDALPLVCVLAGHVIWGFTYTVQRIALQYSTPEIMLANRFVIAAIIMTLLMLSPKNRFRIKGKKLTPIICLAIVQPLYFIFESYGVLYSNASISGIVLAVAPVVSIILAVFLINEYPSKRQAIFCVLPVIGVIMVTVSGAELGVVGAIGIFFLVASCISSGFFRVVNRAASEEYSTFERTYTIMTSCAVVFVIQALIKTGGDVKAVVAPMANPVYLLSVLFLALFCSIAANLLVNYASGVLPVVKTSVFGSVTTLCSMFSGIFFLHEPVSAMSLLGAFLIIYGIRQVTKPAKAKE